MQQAEQNPTSSLPGSLGVSDVAPVLAVITVTYNPDIAVLSRQLSQLPPRALKVLVDNASAPELLELVRQMVLQGTAMILVENRINVGLAQALNQGARRAQALAPTCEYLVLLDQDTEPGSGGVESLLAAFQSLSKTHAKLGCVGPGLLDVNTGLEHGFHQISGWRWVRRFPDDGFPLPVANLNGSGTLMPVALFNELGGLAEDFFIDHVDTDWSFRVLAAGNELFGIPGVQFRHRMGVMGIRFWFFGWRVWPYRSSARHYYLFRNTIRLLRTEKVPLVWKIWAPVKLLVTLVVHLLFDRARFAQVKEMFRGVRDGLAG